MNGKACYEWSVRSLHSRAVLLTTLLLLTLSQPAAALDVAFRADVPARKLKSVRIRNLAKGAVVSVSVQSDGEIIVAFIGPRDPTQPSQKIQPLFSGRLERRLTFSVTIPAAGHYYVIFDNRSGEDLRTISARIRTRPQPPKDITKEKSRTM